MIGSRPTAERNHVLAVDALCDDDTLSRLEDLRRTTNGAKGQIYRSRVAV
jgi:hypothetical protein